MFLTKLKKSTLFGDLIARVSKPSTIDCDVATAWDGKNIPCAISNLEQLHFFFSETLCESTLF